MHNPKYSICMCNYNMEDTLERSLSSILEQLTDDFEVLVVDDGSTDGSLNVLMALQERYPLLRVIKLDRDRNRKLGLTRNVSIEQARGKYVLPQLDCDDVYESCIQDFVKIYHMLEGCIDGPFYLKGLKINMGSRDHLLGYGPYRNIYRGEDRDLWVRLAARGEYFPLRHKPFHRRLSRRKKGNLTRIMFNQWDQIVNTFRAGAEISFFLKRNAKNVFFNPKDKLSGVNLIIAFPAWVVAKKKGSMEIPSLPSGEKFGDYRNRMEKTASEWLSEYGKNVDLSELSPKGKILFGS